ncbi:hypothetical protein [Clavibacter michiganensis]|uniref:hypothetical protein n=1 Tax=Clavibacter michiganensis TaxID=28447 RepID=UPI00374E16F3
MHAPAAATAAVPPGDVLRFPLGNGARLIVRPGGTEPKIKVYPDAQSTEGTVAERRDAARAVAQVEAEHVARRQVGRALGEVVHALDAPGSDRGRRRLPELRHDARDDGEVGDQHGCLVSLAGA